MSSRLAGGRRVSMAPNRIRRPKRDPSGLADTEEEASSGRLKNAIFNDEIARLRIREEDLVKVSREARAGAGTGPGPGPDDPTTTTYTRVAVRKAIPEAERRAPLRRVVLLRRAPLQAACDSASDLPRCPSEGQRRPGPRLDQRGNVVPHSLLGRPEEFYRIGLSRGHLRPDEVPPAYRSAEWAARLYGDEAPALRDAEEEEERMANGSSRPEAQTDDSAGSVKYRWTPDRLLDLPALVSGDSWTSRPASSTATSARAHNRAVFIGSSLPVRRLTEQLNQCGIASPMKHLTGSCTDLDSSRPASSSVRSVVLAGPQYSFIGGWSYQKTMLLG